MKEMTPVVAAVACAAWTMALADVAVVYENDFATRTSEGAVPYGGWRSVNYVAGQLLANTNWSMASQFVEGDLQDNWLKAPNTGRSNAYIDDDGGNYVARLGDDSTMIVDEATGRKTGGHVMIRQRIGNTFTNGIVTVTFDMLPPSAWWYYSGNAANPNVNRCARLALGNENAYTLGANTTNTPLRVGACYYDGARRIYHLDGSGISRLGEITSGHWLRYVVTVNMDTRTWQFCCYDLGTVHPTKETETPSTPLYATNNLAFASTKEPVTSISTISIDGYAVLAGNSAVRFDNIRVAHNGTECYVNDFNERKSRSLLPSAATTNYVAERTSVNEVGTTVYKKMDNILPSGTADYTSFGLDGWKRRNGKASLSIIDGNQNLSVTNHSLGSFVIGAHPIGMTATNGVLRFRGDVRTPSTWSTSNRYAYFLLGGDQMFTASNTSDFSAGCYLRVGMQETNTFYRVYSGGKQTDTINKTVVIGKGRWYRVIVTVDLDHGTYCYEIRDQGTAATIGGDSADGTLVDSRSGLVGNSAVDHISCYGVAEYGALNCKFDNIKVWYTPSGSLAEELVYSNLFNTRKVFHHESSMNVGSISSNPTGMDGWTRLGTSSGTFLISNVGEPLVNEGSQSLVFGDGDEVCSTAVHDLGGVYKGGAMTAQADICAPTAWQDAGGCANIWFGNDQYHEGNLNGGAYNYEKMAAFGFGITNTAFAAFRGDRLGGGEWETSGEATPGHWYRFAVTAKGKMSDVSVYDMGTIQPTLETATPATPVATFSALPFRIATGMPTGVSCVGVSVMGVKNPTAWSHLLPGGTDVRLKVDNIRVTFDPGGLVILVR